MITRKTKFSDLLDIGVGLVEDPESCAELGTAQKAVIKDPSLTVGDWIDGKVSRTLNEAHFLGVLIEKGKECSSKVRIGLIERIENPMAALQAYVKLEGVTNSEKMLLKKKFEGLLPTAEKELKEGKLRKDK